MRRRQGLRVCPFTPHPRGSRKPGPGDQPALCSAHPALPTARAGGPGNIKTLGDAYEFAVDVSDFSPEDIIVTTSNNHIEVRAEKVSLFPRRDPGLHTRTLCTGAPPHPATSHPGTLYPDGAPQPPGQTGGLASAAGGPQDPITALLCPRLPGAFFRSQGSHRGGGRSRGVQEGAPRRRGEKGN